MKSKHMNAHSSKDSTFFVITRFLIEQKQKLCSPIVFKLSGNFISDKLTQPAKALSPMLVTPSGIVTLSNFTQ